MREIRLLDVAKVHFHSFHYRSLLYVFKVYDCQIALAVHFGYFFFAKIHHFVGIFNNRSSIGAYVELVVAHTNNQWATFSGSYKAVGVVLVYNHYSVGTHHIFKSQLHSFEQITAVQFFDVFYELYKHLGVGFAFENLTMIHHFLFQRLIILNNTIVYKS